MFQFDELPESRSGDAESAEYKYFSHGSGDRAFILNTALAFSPASVSSGVGVLYRQDSRIKIDFDQSGIYATVSVPYVTADRAQPNVGSMRISFDTTGGTAVRKQAYEHVGTFAKSPYSQDVNFSGAINVTKDGVEGCDTVIPELKLMVAFRHALGFLSLGQIRNLARATGTVNETTFLGFEPGEVLFLGATGSQGTDSEAEVTYSFGCSENIVDEMFGEIEATKDGWDFMWFEFSETEMDDSPIRNAIRAHVDRVYRRKDLAAILGFGS